MNHRIGTISAIALAVAGCAHTPDVEVRYYLAKSAVSVKVIRTVACDGSDVPIVASAVMPSVTHTADTAQRGSISLNALRGMAADPDATFTFTEDGRLKSINASSVGQGEAILKAFVTLAGTVMMMTEGTSYSYPELCAFIKKAGDGKPLSVTYEGPVNLSMAGQQQDLPAAATSSYYAERLEPMLGGVCVAVGEAELPQQPVVFQPAPDDVLLSARQPGHVPLKVRAGKRGTCSEVPLWDGSVAVAQAGTPYKIPIPRGAFFGKQVFAVSFAESGALSSLQYAALSGDAQALNATNAMAAGLKPDTTAEKLGQVKAEADLIAQQERLVRCKANPTDCK
jgi:hypothetical protein